MRFVLLFLVLPWYAAFGQNALTVLVLDGKSREPIAGANAVIHGTSIGGSADLDGRIKLWGIPDGTHELIVGVIGYERSRQTLTFPRSSGEDLVVLLTVHEKELDEVIVSTTRSSRTISDEPTRMEVVAAEELDEKSNMKPGDIRMLLYESTGIQVQQTSATTANASIRIQGLGGRYTQILKDGFPLYCGFSGGLSLMQIPPLDLQQVEVIKGSASTLYGGGAIAGLVNLISKTPGDEPELSLHLNGTSAGGLDLSGFYSQQFNGTGLALFAARNSNKPYDPADIDLTAIPKFERYTLNPRLFLSFGESSKLTAGVNMSFEDRLGGDIHYIKNSGDSIHSYFEKNKSARVATQLAFEHRLDEEVKFTLRNSVGVFDRLLQTPGYRFDGNQLSSFTEATVSLHGEAMEWIAGVNLTTEEFDEARQMGVIVRDYSQTVIGGFVQIIWNASTLATLETGVRVDHSRDYGTFVLPRASVLFRLARDLTSRVGGGLGYKLPTVFTEEAEVIQFKDVLPIANSTSAEKSYGGNVDVNYRGVLADDLTFNLNQLFYYTRLNAPLQLVPVTGGALMFMNSSGHIDTRGLETNIKLTYDHLKLFLGYTFTDTRWHVGSAVVNVPLTPRHRFNSVLMYEEHDSWRAGLEAYYYGRQALNDGATGRSYWICGFMVEKMWEGFSLYINFENFLDTRQTRYGSIYEGTITQPRFKDIYAPMDGFVVNGGVKVRL